MPARAPALDHIPATIRAARDYADAARDFMADATYAYVDGGSGAGATAAANLRAFEEVAVWPRALRPLAGAQTQLSLPGAADLDHPVLLAPVAYQRLVHPGGECESARAASATGTCLVASTLASRTLEEIAAAAASAPRWFQLYFQPDPAVTASLVRRAEALGYTAIVVTVDAALQVPNHRALALGFRLPPQVTAANLADHAQSPPDEPGGEDRVFRLAARNAVGWPQLEALRGLTSLPIWIKGILHPDDARELRQRGFAGIVVSNHGGRGLDGAAATLRALPAIRAAVGEGYPLLLDGGVRSGLDVFKAIARGADGVLVGRLPMYALAVAGALGVAHLLRCLREELQLCMALSGCVDLAAVRAARVE